VAGAPYVIIALSFGLAAAVVGKIKGSSFFLWLLIGTFVPVLGLVTALVYRWDSEELRRQCPRCGKVVKLHDALCTRCGEELDFPEEAIVSQGTEKRLRAG
jgi:membrane protein implicated in regulation of membrane protease activity